MIMSCASSGTSGTKNPFNVVKPLGDVFEWRCFRRDEDVEIRVCDYLSLLIVEGEHITAKYKQDNVMKTLKKLLLRGAGEYTIEPNSECTFPGQICVKIDGLNNVEPNDFLWISETPPTDRTGDNFNRVPWDGIYKRMYRVINTDNDTIRLQPNPSKIDVPIIPQTRYIALITGLDPLVPEKNDPIRAMAPGGWCGDPLEIRQKNKNGDPASFHLELVFRSSENGTPNYFEEFDRQNCVIEETIETLAEDLAQKLREDRVARFESYLKNVQSKMRESWKESFGPLTDDDPRAKRYVLLQTTSHNEPRDADSTYVNIRQTIFGTNNMLDTSNTVLRQKDERTSAVEPKPTYEERAIFKLISGSLESYEQEGNLIAYVSNRGEGASLAMSVSRTEIPFTVQHFQGEDAPKDFFDSGDSHACADMPETYGVNRIKIRLQNLRDQMNRRLDVPTVEDTGSCKKPFEYELHYSDDVHILTELRTCIRLIGHSMFATTTIPKEEFIHKPKLDINISYPECNKSMPVSTEGMSPSEARLFNKLTSNLRPWRNGYDFDEGACAHRFWKRLLKYTSAPQNEQRRMGLPQIGTILLNMLPFGPLEHELGDLVESLVEMVMTNPKITSVENGTRRLRSILLLQDTDAADMPYIPLTLNFGFHMDHTNDFDTFAWSLGTTPVLFVETIQVLVMFFQKLASDALHGKDDDTSNSAVNVRKREEDSGWDTYPMGFSSAAQLGHVFENGVALRPSTLNSFAAFDVSCGQVRPLDDVHTEKLGLGLLFDKVGKTNTHEVLPGNEKFFKSRKWMRKEIVFVDSIPDVLPTSETAKWTGIEAQTHALTTKPISFKTNVHCTGTGVEWITYPSESRSEGAMAIASEKRVLYGCRPEKRMRVSFSSGAGEWKVGHLDMLNIRLHYEDYTKQRYRKYTGAIPSKVNVSNEEKTYQNRVMRDTFNSATKETHWIFPEIKIAEKGKKTSPFLEKLSKWLCDTFVGFHYGSKVHKGYTEFALAVGKHYEEIQKYFAQIDPLTSEEYGIRIFNPQSNQIIEAKLLQILASGGFGRDVFAAMGGPLQRQKLVIPGVVLVKGGIDDQVVTRCRCNEFLVKTETYRIVESEIWAQLSKTLKQYPNLPKDANKKCLAKELLRIGMNNLPPLKVRQILQLHSPIWASLARLMLALHIQNESWTNSKQYHYRAGLQTGTSA